MFSRAVAQWCGLQSSGHSTQRIIFHPQRCFLPSQQGCAQLWDGPRDLHHPGIWAFQRRTLGWGVTKSDPGDYAPHKILKNSSFGSSEAASCVKIRVRQQVVMYLENTQMWLTVGVFFPYSFFFTYFQEPVWSLDIEEFTTSRWLLMQKWASH